MFGALVRAPSRAERERESTPGPKMFQLRMVVGIVKDLPMSRRNATLKNVQVKQVSSSIYKDRYNCKKSYNDVLFYIYALPYI